jgi:hypothetical protein
MLLAAFLLSFPSSLILSYLISPYLSNVRSDSPLAKEKNVARGKSFGLLMFLTVSAVSLDGFVITRRVTLSEISFIFDL